jgi:hypothetical protein
MSGEEKEGINLIYWSVKINIETVKTLKIRTWQI